MIIKELTTVINKIASVNYIDQHNISKKKM